MVNICQILKQIEKHNQENLGEMANGEDEILLSLNYILIE